jgi:predicted RNase H-like nuclease (RuvC/YqgF family)
MTITKEDIKRVVRGPSDLEEVIEKLEKQKELLKFHCKKAGARIKQLESLEKTLVKDIDRLSEENNNLKTIVKGEK